MPSIRGFKNNKPIVIRLYPRDTFKRPGIYERLSEDRIIGVDTESFPNRDYGAEWKEFYNEDGELVKKYMDGIRTNLVAADFAKPDRSMVAETRDYDDSIVALLDHLFPLFAETELNPALTKQRPLRKRADGTHRDERRQWVEPVVMVDHNLGYDLSRLIGNNQQFLRAITARKDSVRIEAGGYNIEIRQIIPSDNAFSFEFYIRRDGKIMRLIGRDTWAYIKSSLEEAAETFLGQRKDYLDKGTFDRIWEEMTTNEIDRLKQYVATDARLARELYEVLIKMLTRIDKHVICRNGILPKSAAGAASKISFAMASLDEWPRPIPRFMEMGAMAFAGGKVFNRKPGIYDGICGYDGDFFYPAIGIQLPNPCTCNYVEVGRGPYNHSRWRGQWGVLMIDGEGLDPYYPALRVHDQKSQRLRYIYGPFYRVLATIPEIVLGVESGRLRVDRIHEGVHMQSTNDGSFVKEFELKMYELKCRYRNDKKNPMYKLAKLLGHSLPGKLAEVAIDEPYLEEMAQTVMFPDIEDIIADREIFEGLYETYIKYGWRGLEVLADEMSSRYRYTEDIPFRDIAKRYAPTVGRAGSCYLPLHAAQITGMGSARLSLAAWCTGAVSGITDSLFMIGKQIDGFRRFHELERAAGYESPEEGMGSFNLEMENAHGVLLRGNLYVIRWNSTNKETGKSEELEKRALHGLPHMNPDDAYEYLKRLHEYKQISYMTKASPRKLTEAFMEGEEPGIFEQHKQERTLETDPNMVENEQGEHLWKVYDGSHSWVKPHNDGYIKTGIVITWSQYQQLLRDSRYSLNQDTTPPAIESSSLQDATK